MTSINFKGFGGAAIKAEVSGSPDNPTVLLLHGGGRTGEAWTQIGQALVDAGRYAISIDFRGPALDTRRQFQFEEFVEGLRLVLDQLPSRPVIVATSLGGWIACAALGESTAPVASGLVLCDEPPNIVSKPRDQKLKAQNGERPEIDWDPAYQVVFDSASMRSRLSTAAAKITIPVMYVHTGASEASEHIGTAFLQGTPNVELLEISSADHAEATERLDQFNAVLLDFLERKDPRTPPEYIAGSDSRTLRNAMGCFATGITVVTTLWADSTPVGLTANSFTSVSLDPPLLLICLAKSSSSLSAFEQSDKFAVNILHIGQQPTSNLFTSKTADRFGQVDWSLGETGVPILTNSLASMECTCQARHDGGDHVIIVGKVERARFEPRRDPLLYFSGKYRRLHLG